MIIQHKLLHKLTLSKKSFNKRLPHLINHLFSEAKKFWEYEIRFGAWKYIDCSYVRLHKDWESYISLTSGDWGYMKRSKKDIIFILSNNTI